MIRIIVVGKTAYLTEESDSAFRKSHQLRSQDMELIATYSNRDAIGSRQYERALKQYNVENVIDELPVVKRIGPPDIFNEYPPERIAQIKQKISEALTGRKLSEETKARMAQAKRNRPSNNKGRKRSIIANINQSQNMKGKRCVAGYVTYSEPYSGKQIRLPEGVNPPPGFIKGLTEEQIQLRREVTTNMWRKKRKLPKDKY